MPSFMIPTEEDRRREQQHREARDRYYQMLKDGYYTPEQQVRHPECFKGVYLFSQLPRQVIHTTPECNSAVSIKFEYSTGNDAQRILTFNSDTLMTIKTAVDAADLMSLQYLLGPVYRETHKISYDSKHCYWGWLKARCGLLVLEKIECTTFAQAQAVGFVIHLDAGGVRAFKRALDEAINQLVRELRSSLQSWNLSSGIEEMVIGYAGALAEREKKYWLDYWRYGPRLDEMLHAMCLKREKLETICAKQEKNQEERNRTYYRFEFKRFWDKFQSDWERRLKRSLGVEIRELKKRASVSLGQHVCVGDAPGRSLLDYAIQRYAQSPEPGRRAIIAYLLLRGATPSEASQPYLSWGLSEMLLQYVDPQTPVREALCQELFSYCKKSQLTEQSRLVRWWVPNIIFNAGIFRGRCQNVAELTILLCGSKDPFNDKRLWQGIERVSAAAPRGSLGRSRLFNTLARVRGRADCQALLAVPTASTPHQGDVEMCLTIPGMGG